MTRGMRRGRPLPGTRQTQDPPSVLENSPPNTFFDQPVELGRGLPNYSGGMGEVGESGIVSQSDTVIPRNQYDVTSVSNAFNSSGFVAGANRYYIVEGMYWFNETDNVVGSTFFGTDDQDGAAGGRFTIGQKQGVRGREFVYTGFTAFVSNTTSLCLE